MLRQASPDEVQVCVVRLLNMAILSLPEFPAQPSVAGHDGVSVLARPRLMPKLAA